MSFGNLNLAILIAQVSHAGALAGKIEDKSESPDIQSCHDLIIEIMKKYEGNPVRNTGNQIVYSFPSANYATNAAISMNKALDSILREQAELTGHDTAISIHTGIHYGETTMVNSNVIFGDAVKIATELVNLAQKEYIFTTGSTVDLLSPELQELAYFVKNTNLKYDQENIELFEINWKQEP